MNLRGTKALVVGMKKSGVASAELLAREGALVCATDLKPLDQLPEAREALERLHIPFARQTPEVFEGYGLIVISPDVPADLAPLAAARQHGASVMGEVELAAPFLLGSTMGITGSNGKTTTTSLIGHILAAAGVPVQVGGNIGKPVTAMIDNSRDDGWNVLELSSFQLETISRFRAHVGLALNVTQNHLDRHHTFENYAAAKARLFETQRPGDFAVLNAEDSVCASFAGRTAAMPQWFSSAGPVSPGAWLCGGTLMLDGEPLMQSTEIPIRGLHNVENVLAASIAAARAGVEPASIAAAVRTFQAVEHRLEFVRRVSGIDFYNDSKATSVDAT
ncbi:MAG: UDP-N-acetylmuramoyl-L-alanine--D-glutamate ligase, partial [Acidobacteriia bacterium]|nr:UDP-N-acetylmuramoyl-L-alanine--D-glutamate ligase [Terriglobia bacterium]